MNVTMKSDKAPRLVVRSLSDRRLTALQDWYDDAIADERERPECPAREERIARYMRGWDACEQEWDRRYPVVQCSRCQRWDVVAGSTAGQLCLDCAEEECRRIRCDQHRGADRRK